MSHVFIYLDYKAHNYADIQNFILFIICNNRLLPFISVWEEKRYGLATESRLKVKLFPYVFKSPTFQFKRLSRIKLEYICVYN